MVKQKKLQVGLLCFLLAVADFWVAKHIQPAAAVVPVALEAVEALCCAAAAVVTAYTVSKNIPKQPDQHHIHGSLLQNSSTKMPSAQSSKRIPKAITPTIVADVIESEVQQYGYEPDVVDALANDIESSYEPPIRNSYGGSYLTPSFPKSHSESSRVVKSLNAVRVYPNGQGVFAEVGIHQGYELPYEQLVEIRNNAIAAMLYEHVPEYRKEINRQMMRFISVFDECINNDVDDVWKIYSRLKLFHTIPPDAPFGNNARDARFNLYYIFYNRDGKLRPISDPDVFAKAMRVLAKLISLSCPKSYKKNLRNMGYTRSQIKKALRWNVGKWCDQAWKQSTRPGHKQRVKQNEYNVRLHKLFNFCFADDFYAATALAQSINDENSKIIYDHFFAGRYDVFGMSMEYAHDPVWKDLSHGAKQQIKSAKNGIKLFQNYLAIRAKKRQELKASFKIVDDKNKNIAAVLYALCDLSNVELIDKTIDVINAYKSLIREQLLDAFFLPNGILKNLARHESVKKLTFDIDLLKPENSEWLRCVNHDVYDILFETDYDAEQTTVEEELLYFQDGMNDTPPPNDPNNTPPGGSGDPGNPDDDDDEDKQNNDKDPDKKKKLKSDKIRKFSEQDALDAWEASRWFKKLRKRVKELMQKVEIEAAEDKYNKVQITEDHELYYQKADKIYDKIRNSPEDINKISKNTGLSRGIIKKIKDHVFFKRHILHERTGRFDSNLDMGEAWWRLTKGDFVGSDLKLLEHEYAEHVLMTSRKVDYQNAHDITNNTYNWYNLLRK